MFVIVILTLTACSVEVDTLPVDMEINSAVAEEVYSLLCFDGVIKMMGK